MDTEIKKVKGGSFKTMNLHKQLLYNIPFTNPTPIQRKIIPLIINKKSVMGIGRTGSGKTYCYLIPGIQKAIDNKNVLIIVPTKELVAQVKRSLKYLCRNIQIQGIIEICTPGRLIHNTDRNDNIIIESTDGTTINMQVDLLVADEIDRILEEPDLCRQFDVINEKLECQKIFFSATKPSVHLDCNIVEVDNKINEEVRYIFFYTPSVSKESVLLHILQDIKSNKTNSISIPNYVTNSNTHITDEHQDTSTVSVLHNAHISEDNAIQTENTRTDILQSKQVLNTRNLNERKIIIFASTKYTVDYLLEILESYGYNCRGIYSSMDNQARMINYKDFVKGVYNILVVTDVAARGLDIPLLDLVINYDLCDEKTFLHRETYLKDAEIGLVPSSVLDEYDVSKFLYLKVKTEKGYEKCLKFRSKVSVPDEYKNKVSKFKVHSYFDTRDNLSNKLQKHFNRNIKEKKKVEETVNKYKDQFYIPYTRKDNKIHSSTFGVSKDDYVIEKKDKFKRSRISNKKS